MRCHSQGGVTVKVASQSRWEVTTLTTPPPQKYGPAKPPLTTGAWANEIDQASGGVVEERNETVGGAPPCLGPRPGTWRHARRRTIPANFFPVPYVRWAPPTTRTGPCDR